MSDVPFAFAFAAGSVATVNPCGFAMLPAYLSYFLGLSGDGEHGGEEGGDAVTAGVRSGLGVGAAVSLGFFVVFGVVGVLFEAGLRSVIDWVPWVALGIGVALIALGVAMAGFGWQPTFALPKMQAGRISRRWSSMFAFGVTYAVASLSCALPVFLTVVATATATSASVFEGLLTFLTYGAGMAFVLLGLTLAVSLAREGLVRRLRRAVRYVTRVSGVILVLTGAYVTWYWSVNLSDPLGASGGPVSVVERAQTWVSDQIGTRPEFWAVTLSLVVGMSLAWALAHRGSPTGRDREPSGGAGAR